MSDAHSHGPYIPPLGVPQWPDDGLRHRIALAVEVSSGPGVEIISAELLLDIIEGFTRQGLAPASVSLRISSGPRPGR